jgi:prepilin-type N-terminal cleavage/methylation domain-containing protein
MKTITNRKRNPGFTLTEVMVATVLLTLVCASVFAAFKSSLRWTRAGTSQAQFMANARIAGDNILSLIERGKSITVLTNSYMIKINFPDLSSGTIYFTNSDNNVSTVADNVLVYDPTPGTPGNSYVLCTYVRPVDEDTNSLGFGDPSRIFTPTNNQDNPIVFNSVMIRFHVGDGTNVQDLSFSGTGQGYQGTEVRMSATPRNVQKWYNE